MIPKKAERAEDSTIDVFEKISRSSESARFEINNDIVKPMPAKILTQKISGQFNPLPKWASLSFTAIKEKSIIPTGFPITSPVRIP